jgi:hypothetical protein
MYLPGWSEVRSAQQRARLCVADDTDADPVSIYWLGEAGLWQRWVGFWEIQAGENRQGHSLEL